MIVKPRRVVLDTNVVLAGLLAPKSSPSRVISSLYGNATILVSVDVIEELDEVFRRPKFDRYQNLSKRLNYLWTFLDLSKLVMVSDRVIDCRDAKDNKFLELALSGRADFIITGDSDLLALHPWRGIGILSPADYLALSE